MAKLKSKIFKFFPSTSPDVVGYKVYVDLPGALTYMSPSADAPDLTVHGDGKIHVDLAILSVASSKDGIYDVAVTTVDDAGNESDMAILNNVNLDFIAPDAPTGLEIA